MLCPSPDGVCDERVVKHAKCVANGLPLESSDIKVCHRVVCFTMCSFPFAFKVFGSLRV